jgi:hypothetical protein
VTAEQSEELGDWAACIAAVRRGDGYRVVGPVVDQNQRLAAQFPEHGNSEFGIILAKQGIVAANSGQHFWEFQSPNLRQPLE